jgi:hypothetical protein
MAEATGVVKSYICKIWVKESGNKLISFSSDLFEVKPIRKGCWMFPRYIAGFLLMFTGLTTVGAQTDTLAFNDSTEFKGPAKTITWRDRGGQPRTISINKDKGHISRYQYDVDCPDIWNNSMSGLNAIISHYSNDYLSSRTHGTDFTFTDVLRGKYHAIHRVSFFWPHYIRAANIFLPKKIKITFDYLVITGQDCFLIAYTWDTGRLPCLDGRDDKYDARAPYCDISWNGSSSLIDVARKLAKWKSGTDCTFILDNMVTGAWRKTFHDNLVTYNYVWDDSLDREMGIVSTEKYRDKPMGDEWRDGDGLHRSCTDTAGNTFPQAAPFQNTYFDNFKGEKIIWGSAWCVGKNSAVCSTTVIRAYPYYNYAVMVLLGRHSEQRTEKLVREQERYDRSSLTNVRGGKVMTSGPAGPADTTRAAWNKAGYNPVYRTWEVWTDSSKIQFDFNGDTLVNPTFVVNNYSGSREPETVRVSSLKSGGRLTNGVDYYASLDQAQGRLFVTIVDTFTGTSTVSLTTLREKVASISLSPQGGTAFNRMEITLSTTTPAARLYYTLDGSAPDSHALAYTGPFMLTDSGVVKAIGYQAGLSPSEAASAVFDIITDTTAPAVDSIYAYGDTEQVIVYFSEEVEPATAENPANYNLNNGAAVQRAVRDFYLHNKVYLSLADMVPNTDYQLALQGIKDLAGNAVPTGTSAVFQLKAYPAPSIQDSLKGCWSFNEGSGTTAGDISGMGNQGTVYGAQWTAGRFGQALLFSGDTGTYVDVGTGNFNIDKKHEFTVALWIKRLGEVTGALIRRGTGAYPFALEYVDSGFVRNSVRTYAAKYLAGRSALVNGTWGHVALTYMNGRCVFYMNGVPDTSRIIEGFPALGSTQRTEIGRGFNGVIDAVRIYNRALRTEEIMLLYNQATDTTKIIRVDLDQHRNITISLQPNPFTVTSGITFMWPGQVPVSQLCLYDLSGRLVEDFLLETRPNNVIHWNGKTRDGQMVAAGIYMLRVTAGPGSVTRRILLTR